MSVTMRQMLEAGVHFGHQTRFWNPKMAPFIFGHRNKIHIINLEKSLPMLQEAQKFARQLAANRGTVLFVGTKRQAREIVAEEARRCGMPYVEQRWLGGMLTNFKTVKTSIKRLKDMQAQQEAGLDSMSKKEQLMFSREMEKLERDIGGIQDMGALPDAIFVIDVGYHKIAVSEAKKLGVPLIGVVDSNHNPDGIDYVIPGNDDAIRSCKLVLSALADAVLERFGRVDIVVNNAGVGPTAPIKDLTLADWRWMIDVNLWGVINGIHVFLPLLRANPDGGHIVNTASMAVFNPLPGLGPYTAVYRALYHLPGFSLARVPARWMLLVVVGGAVLAALGLEEVRRRGLARSEALLRELGLAYRVVDLCTGDLGASAARTWDIEAYAPGCDLWLEVSSVSWFGDYQARRASIRYRRAEGKGTEVCHTVNGSAMGWPRTVAAYLETHRQPDGTIAVVPALQGYLGGATSFGPRGG